MTLISFPHANDIVDRFVALLDQQGVTPPSKSGLETEFLSIRELLDLTKNPAAAAGRPSLLAEAGGMADMAAKLLAISNQPEFATFTPHLRLFASNSRWASAVQTTPGHGTDDVHRKIAELYLGSLAVHVGHNVELDDPDRSRGDNPDVLFDYPPHETDGVKRWALAIKTISSRSGQTIFERIAEAARQINASSCPAHRGIVVINAQGSLKHDELWSTSFGSEEEAMQALTNQLSDVAASACANRSQTEWDEALAERASPIVLYLGQSVVRVPTPLSAETPTILKVMYAHSHRQLPDPEVLTLATAFNHYMQTLTKGRPGVAGVNGQQPE